MTRRVVLGSALCLLCLWSSQALGCAFGGEMVTTTVFKAFGEEAVRWAQQAEREPPVLLRISHVNSYPVTDIIEVDDPAVIAAYLNEFRTLGVNMNRPEKSPEGAYTTYIFYTRDGRSPTFVFEGGKACIGTQWDGFTLYPVVGIEDLEQMDEAQRARQNALKDHRAWAQTPDWFQFWDHTVELRLPENDYIGYVWSQRVESEGALVLIEDMYRPGWPPLGDDDEVPGDGEEPWGERSYTYRAVGAGEAVIRLTLTGPDGSFVRVLSCKVRFSEDGVEALERVDLDGGG